MVESTPEPKNRAVEGAADYGAVRRGISAIDVERAADALLRAGERPTVLKVRARLGSGSPNTINPLLDAWWKKFAGRAAADPPALQRLPDAVAHLAESLWLAALEESRRRVADERPLLERNLASDRQHLDVRAHVLSLRESELETRLAAAERARQMLEAQVSDLTLLLKKAQATAEHQRRRIEMLEADLLALRTRPTARTPPRNRIAPAAHSPAKRKAPARGQKKRKKPQKRRGVKPRSTIRRPRR